jgi:hypothetical protein
VAEFLVEETAVREAGESPVFDCGENALDLVLTMGITHAIEQESIEVTIFDSPDGVRWKPVPLVRFTPKYYCGVYQMSVPRPRQRYLKAAWRVERWGNAARPYFGFYLHCAAPTVRSATMAAV